MVKKIVSMVLILAGLYLTGYGVYGLISDNNEAKAPKTPASIVKESPSPKPIPTPNTSTAPVTKKTAKLYFANSDMTGLVAEQRDIILDEKKDFNKQVIEELIKGYTTKGLSRTVAEDTKVNSVKIEQKVAIVDFGGDFITKNSGGSTKEIMCLNSIVNTLCALDGVDAVSITVEGKPLKELGQLIVEEKMKINNEIIKF